MITNSTVRKRCVHYTAEYLVNPAHPVTINLIGCGGTGSQVLNTLGRMHSALVALGHPGLFVRAIDPDKVTVANFGRQLFSRSDVDEYKCNILIGRINRFFGTDWEGITEEYKPGTTIRPANVTISCVDSGKSRNAITKVLYALKEFKEPERIHGDRTGYLRTANQAEPYEIPYYWMDYGNTSDRGQVIIGTLRAIKQPPSEEFNCLNELRTVEKLHPDILKDNKDDNQGPSCSLAEALNKQDLLINSNLGNWGLNILWKMFRELRIFYHGSYVNLESGITMPLPITAPTVKQKRKAE